MESGIKVGVGGTTGLLNPGGMIGFPKLLLEDLIRAAVVASKFDTRNRADSVADPGHRTVAALANPDPVSAEASCFGELKRGVEVDLRAVASHQVQIGVVAAGDGSLDCVARAAVKGSVHPTRQSLSYAPNALRWFERLTWTDGRPADPAAE